MIFLESPWPILIVGLVAEATLAIILLRTGRGVLLWAMGGVALVVLLGVLVERMVVTDTKLIRRTLDGAAAGLAANDFKRVESFITPTGDGNAARDEARWALGVAEFMDLSIRNLEVSFNRTGPRPTAKTTFVVVVHGRARHGDFLGEITRMVPMEVTLRKEMGRWLIYGRPVHDERGQ